jgi:flagellar protein FliL
MRKLLPILLALLGLGAGLGAGLFLQPAAEHASAGEHAPADHPETSAPAHPAAAEPAGHGGAEHGSASHSYVKLNNQFIVPIMAHGKVAALVIMSLSLEVAPGTSAKVYAAEPKLRDAFLQVLFDHANAGGFSGNFTDGTKMQVLRDALKEMAVKVMGPMVTDVLIDDIVRQDT